MSSLFHQSRGEGQPIILIHGFCETHAIWGPLSEHLPSNHQVIAIDLPGFGQSPPAPEPASIDSIAEHVQQWIVDSGLNKPLLVGHSLGGYVCLSMIAQNPEIYSGLILFHSTSRPDTVTKKINRLKVLEFVAAHGLHSYIDSFIPSLFHNKIKEDVDFALNVAHGTRETTFVEYTKAMRDRPSRELVLHSALVPTLLIAGKEDSIIPYVDLTEQVELNPEIQLYLMENVGHMGMLEAKKEAAKVVSRFARTLKS